jgi:hypothetical protein
MEGIINVALRSCHIVASQTCTGNILNSIGILISMGNVPMSTAQAVPITRHVSRHSKRRANYRLNGWLFESRLMAHIAEDATSVRAVNDTMT